MIESHASGKVKFSLKNKLLLFFSILSLVSIFLLTFATIYIFQKDKIAYTYEKQSVETLLASKELIYLCKQALDSLTELFNKAAFGKASQDLLKTVLINQDQLVHVKYIVYHSQTEVITSQIQESHTDLIQGLGILDPSFLVDKELIQSQLESLLVNGFSFFQAFKTGEPPLLGVFLGKKESKDSPVFFLTVGFLPLLNYQNELKGQNISVITYQGGYLFSVDPESIFKSAGLVNENPFFQFILNQKTASGSTEFNYKNNKYLGTFVRPELGFIVVSAERWDRVIQATYELIETMIIISIAILMVMIIFVIIFSKTMIYPLQALSRAAEKVSEGDFSVHLNQKTTDEIGSLTYSFQLMSEKIAQLIVKEKESAKLESEIAVASAVQKTLIPEPVFEDSRVYVQSYYQPAQQCGGDWCGYFPYKNKFIFMIADATGHGFSSALITAAAHSCFSTIHKVLKEGLGNGLGPDKMLHYVNNSVYESSKGQIMMTFFVGIIDFDSMTLEYANAAHNPPWLLRFENNQIVSKSLVTKGMRVGEGPELKDLEVKKIPIQKDDFIFLYTDGLPEGPNSEGEQFGKKQLKKIVDNNFKNHEESGLLSEVVDRFLEHNGDQPLYDDVTLLSVKIK